MVTWDRVASESSGQMPKMKLDNCPNDLPDKKTANRRNDRDKNVVEFACHHQRPVFERKEIRSTETADWRLDPRRYSSCVHLVGVYARVQRVVDNVRKAEKRVGRELLPKERRDAAKDIIRLAQRESFQEEYKALAAKKQAAQKSVLVKLNLRLDDQGMIRSDSQLRFEEYLPYDTRFPIVLPKGHWVTRLIVRCFHELANHSAGINFVLIHRLVNCTG